MKLFLIFLALFSFCFADENDAIGSAHIIASKTSLSQYAVEGMDYVMDYRLYNVGDKVFIIGLYVFNSSILQFS